MHNIEVRAHSTLAEDSADEQQQICGDVISSSTTRIPHITSKVMTVIQASQPSQIAMESALDERKERYFFVTKHGTSKEDYYALIKTLPDKGQDLISQFNTLDFQSYITYLTKNEANQVKTEPIVSFICEDPAPEVDDNVEFALPRSQAHPS